MPDKRALLIFLAGGCSVLSSSVNAQNNTRSPYSMFGLGVPAYQGTVQDMLLGGTSVARRGINTISPMNPASYGALKYTVFEGGGKIDLGHLESNGNRSEFSNASVSYFAYAMPLKAEKAGMSFGLLPFHHRGYDLLSRSDTGANAYEASFLGKGDISKAYFGLGFTPVKGLSVGANVAALFGMYQDLNIIRYTGTTDRFGIYEQSNRYFRALSFDAGVQYSIRHKKNFYQNFGFSAQLPVTLRGTTDRLVQNFNHPNFLADPGRLSYDTVLYEKGRTEAFDLPLNWTAGYAIGQADKWQLSVEYQAAAWSQMPLRSLQGTLTDASRFSAGFWYTPRDPKDGKNFYLSRLRYSAGFRQENMPWVYQNKQVQERGMTIGFGLPVSRNITLTGGKENLLSYLHLGVEYIQRGEQGGLQESWYRLHFGFTFCDKWFIKRKYL